MDRKPTRPAGVAAARSHSGRPRWRGERGALQRPRLPLPNWLDIRINGDPWLRVLCLEILTFVGLPDTVRQGLWPLAAWADRRAEVTGEISVNSGRAVADDVERVLAAMRANPPRYERYVERPLGHKQAPLIMSIQADNGLDADRSALQLVTRDEAYDAQLLDVAHEVIRDIEKRLERGEQAQTAVREVVLTSFGRQADAEAMTQITSVGAEMKEHVDELMADPAAAERLTATILKILTNS